MVSREKQRSDTIGKSIHLFCLGSKSTHLIVHHRVKNSPRVKNQSLSKRYKISAILKFQETDAEKPVESFVDLKVRVCNF